MHSKCAGLLEGIKEFQGALAAGHFVAGATRYDLTNVFHTHEPGVQALALGRQGCLGDRPRRNPQAQEKDDRTGNLAADGIGR